MLNIGCFLFSIFVLPSFIILELKTSSDAIKVFDSFIPI